MAMYKISILKEFIEEADNETNAELEAIGEFKYRCKTFISDLRYIIDGKTEEEYKELECKNHSK